MKTFNMIWASFALCALAVSCQNKEIGEPVREPAGSNVQLRTFTCVIAGDAESKVAIDAEGKTTWEEGDEILVHGERIGTSGGKQYSTVVTLTSSDISADGKSATITVATDPDGVDGIVPYIHKKDGVQDYTSTLYAAYPAGAIDQSVAHCYYHNVFSETNLPLMVAYDDGDAFLFKLAGSVISFTMPATEDFDAYTFQGNDGEVVGYQRYTVKTALKADGTESNYFPYTSGDVPDPVSGGKTTISGPVVCDGTTLNQICIPGKLTFEKGFRILFIKDGEIVKYVSNKNHFTLNRADYLPLGDLSARLKTYVPSHESEIPTAAAVDLSADGTANSYVVYANSTAGAVYKFKAVQGNSDASVGTVNSVDVLWETWNNAETVTKNSVVAAADFEGDYIYFQMPETLHAGNAVLAARNAAGTILWSWHVWVPSTEVGTVDNAIFSSPIMDRNLGALVAATAGSEAPVESFGLTYQWGRKDPFPGPKAANSSSNATVAGVALSTTPGSGEADESKITLEQAIQNPTLLGHSQNGNWLLESDNTLWRDDVKTMFDPCPPGYRVPALEGNASFFSSDASTAVGWEENKAQYYFTMGNPPSVFPFAGYRDDYGPESMTHAYDRAAYWSSFGASDAKASYLNVRAGSVHAKADAGKSRGGSVRCVKETAE